jgi:hypothetical protein
MPPQPSEDGPDEQSVVQLSVSKRTLVLAGAVFALMCVAVGIGVFLMAGGSDEPNTGDTTTGGVASSETSQSDATTEQVVLTTPVGVWRTKSGRTITITPTRMGPRYFIDRTAWLPVKSITHVKDVKIGAPPGQDVAIYEILLTGRVAGLDPGDFWVVRVEINLTNNFAVISHWDPDEHAKGRYEQIGKSERMYPMSQ